MVVDALRDVGRGGHGSGRADQLALRRPEGGRGRETWTFGSVGCQPVEQPSRGGTRRRVGAVQARKRISLGGNAGRSSRTRRPASRSSRTDARACCPSRARSRQRVLGPEIGQAPRLGAEHAEVAPLGEVRAVGQHQLHVVAESAAATGPVSVASGWLGADHRHDPGGPERALHQLVERPGQRAARPDRCRRGRARGAPPSRAPRRRAAA